MSALLLIGGALADQVGRRRIFVTGLSIFAAASVGCGLALDVNTLILARARERRSRSAEGNRSHWSGACVPGAGVAGLWFDRSIRSGLVQLDRSLLTIGRGSPAGGFCRSRGPRTGAHDAARGIPSPTFSGVNILTLRRARGPFRSADTADRRTRHRRYRILSARVTRNRRVLLGDLPSALPRTRLRHVPGMPEQSRQISHSVIADSFVETNRRVLLIASALAVASAVSAHRGSSSHGAGPGF
jgi:hypothetical protein